MPTLNIWNGSAWVTNKPLLVWNGSAWITKPASFWNGSSWQCFANCNFCSSCPTISSLVTTLYQYNCTSQCGGTYCTIYTTTVVTLSAAIGTCVVRFEYSTDGGTTWTLGQEGSSTSYNNTSVCCIGCTGGTACSYRVQVRAEVKDSLGNICTSWTTGTDTGTYNGQSGKSLICA